MPHPTVSDIKRSQKERLLLRITSDLFQKAALDNPQLMGIFVNRVHLSPSKGMCTVYFYSVKGKAYFDELLHTLKLYKPSLRKAVAETVNGRYTPDFVFKFDEQFEKQEYIENLLDSLKDETVNEE